jgi:cytochrome P450
VLVAVDTTSNALVRTLFLLAQHQNIQEKLRLGITEARIKRGDPAYEELASLRYLDAVWGETLRLHPPFFYLIRTCVLGSPQCSSSDVNNILGQVQTP